MRTIGLLATLSLVAMVAGTAWAAPVTLDAQVLLRTPGAIAVDQQNLTTVQFCDDVSWLAFKAPWLHAQISPQDRRVLLLDASSEAGTAALSVWVRGQGAPLQLVVRVSGTRLANHVYFVSCGGATRASEAPTRGTSERSPAAAQTGTAAAVPKPVAPAVKAQAPSPAAREGTATWDAFVPSLSPHQWDLLQALIATPTAETSAAFTAAMSPEQQAVWSEIAPTVGLAPPNGQAPSSSPSATLAPVASPALQPAPPWIAFQASIAAAKGGSGMLIPYTVTNTGTDTIVLDTARLAVLNAAGAPISGVLVNREDTSGFEGRVVPGGVESGTIRLAAAPSGTVTLQWPAVTSDSSGTTYVLTRTLQIP